MKMSINARQPLRPSKSIPSNELETLLPDTGSCLDKSSCVLAKP